MPFAVGAYITAAYWFTASTSFANPAVTIARSLTNTFAGIRPIDAPGFIAMQFIGALAATILFRWLYPSIPETADELLVPHPAEEVGCSIHAVSFACVHDAGRSQMSAAFFNKLVDPTKASALSTGTHPADRIHPEVNKAMREVGINLSGARPQRLTGDLTKDGIC